MARKARFNLPGITESLFSLRGVDALKPDAVLGVGVIEDGNAVAISNFHDLAGEGIGESRGGCQQQGRQHSQNGPIHSDPPCVPRWIGGYQRSLYQKVISLQRKII